MPAVFHLNVPVDEYPCVSVHVPPGARIQNSYSGVGQPVAAAVRVTVLPAFAEEAGTADTLTAEQTGVRV
jgi:hypothetical protein